MRTACFLTLLLTVACAGPSFDRWNDTANYQFEMRVDLTQLDQSDTQEVRLWLPKPAHDDVQQVLEYEIDAPWPALETQDDQGNRFVYLEKPADAAPADEILVRFRIRRKPEGIASNSAVDPAHDLATTEQIPLSGAIAATGNEIMAGKATDGERIRAAYDYVVDTMRYDKNTPGWGQGDALRALDTKAGNCTDFHSLFMGLTRSQAIAARFTMGYPIPADQDSGTIGGYHCWSSAYDSELGWTPVDASEAWKAGDRDAFYGHLPSDRIAFTTGRDLVLEPPQAGPPLNFFIYPYAEVSGEPVTPPWTLTFERVGWVEVAGGGRQG
jgi:transglutaminase-like putative cysteine protease